MDLFHDGCEAGFKCLGVHAIFVGTLIARLVAIGKGRAVQASANRGSFVLAGRQIVDPTPSGIEGVAKFGRAACDAMG
jgi:hypothetical protein